MNEKLSKEKTDAILKALDDLVAYGGWDASAFLRVIGKRLRVIRDEFCESAGGAALAKTKITSHLANRVALRSGQQEVFVALYSSDGANMQAWERIVVNLPKQMISRPIYATEEDVIQAIRAKENKTNEAYLAIYAAQDDILPMGDKTPLDKLGKPLLTLKDKSLSLDNINRFVHASGVYQYSHGQLVKEASSEG
jgi:intracellular multiplication protein IcmQ